MKKNKPDYSISNKDIFKGIIRQMLYKRGRMTAKEIRQRTGLGRQTAYNYLNELEEEKLVAVKRESVPNRPNLSVAYYTVIPVRFPAELDDVPLTDKPRNLRVSHEEAMARTNRILDMSIASLIETKIAINNMSQEELHEYYSFSPEVDGYMNYLFLLSDKDFAKWQLEMKKVMNELHEEDDGSGKHDGHTFLLCFFKNL